MTFNFLNAKAPRLLKAKLDEEGKTRFADAKYRVDIAQKTYNNLLLIKIPFLPAVINLLTKFM